MSDSELNGTIFSDANCIEFKRKLGGGTRFCRGTRLGRPRLTQDLRKDDGVVDRGVFGAVEQCRRLAVADPGAHLAERGIALELVAIAAREFREPFGPMIKPCPQRWRRRQLLGPHVERGFFLTQAPRPQPIDQNPQAVPTCGLRIVALGGDDRHGCLADKRRRSLSRFRYQLLMAPLATPGTSGAAPVGARPPDRPRPPSGREAPCRARPKS